MIPSLRALRASLRIRLLAGTLSLIVLLILVLGWGLGSLFRQHIAAQFNAELKTQLDQLTANLGLDAQGRPVLSLPLSDPRMSRPYSGHYWQIDGIERSGDGGAKTIQPARQSATQPGLLRSRSLWDYVLRAPEDSPADGAIHSHLIAGPQGKRLGMAERRVRLDDAPDGQVRVFRLIAAADEELITGPVARFNRALWLALGALATGLAVTAVVQVLVGLAPLRKLRSALGQVRDGRAPRLEGDFPVEIMPLVEEFNTVLAQNAEVVARARTQAGNLAHALKTPLSLLANAASAKTGDDGLARLVSEQVDAARKQVDYHLARAQVAARLPGACTPLPAILGGLERVMKRLYAERELTLSVSLPVASPANSLAFRGDAQDLQEMLGNLLDNACKWAARRVETSAWREKNTLFIAIDDDGDGLPHERRAAVLGRGVRADERISGSGLGLAIVDELAHFYGGKVQLEDSLLGGLRALLVLPAVLPGGER